MVLPKDRDNPLKKTLFKSPKELKLAKNKTIHEQKDAHTGGESGPNQ
jgi:hypothetical protein